jgi:putative ATP-dependent endonuclease of the OLD family
MRVLAVDYRRFRGFLNRSIRPRGHVVLVGEPRAGRSDALEGLARVLGGGGGRLPDPDELDFHDRDTSRRAEVEVVLAELGTALEQIFLDELEFWDTEEEELIEELEDPGELDGESVLTVLRLCYRIEWDDDEGVPRHWVDIPKSSDPDAGQFRRLTRVEREAIPFVGWTASGRVLSLAPRSSFRDLVEQSEGDGLADALERFVEQLEQLGVSLAEVDQVSNALEAVLAPWRHGLGIGDTPAREVVSFLPEGGAVAAILRSLAPALELPNAPALPLARHGSTSHSLAFHGQLIARASQNGIVALVAEAFAPEEIVRFRLTAKGSRGIRYGRTATTKAERLAARQMSIQLLPVMSAVAVVIVEGPHDRAAINALMHKLANEEGTTGLAAYRIGLIDAGAADGSGGTGAVVRIADLANDLGFRVVAVLDYDRSDQADAELAAAEEAADAVIRLPKGFAIERALCDGLSDETLREALSALRDGFGLALPAHPDELAGNDLMDLVVKTLKQSGGLHAEFVAALDEGEVPPTARLLLEEAIAAGTGEKTGHIQLEVG